MKYFIEDTTLTAIGDVIREQMGNNDLVDPANMPATLRSIISNSGGGEITTVTEIPEPTAELEGTYLKYHDDVYECKKTKGEFTVGDTLGNSIRFDTSLNLEDYAEDQTTTNEYIFVAASSDYSDGFALLFVASKLQEKMSCMLCMEDPNGDMVDLFYINSNSITVEEFNSTPDVPIQIEHFGWQKEVLDTSAFSDCIVQLDYTDMYGSMISSEEYYYWYTGRCQQKDKVYVNCSLYPYIFAGQPMRSVEFGNLIIGQIKKIPENAFYLCEKLTSITIPETVTTIGFEAFYYCRNLELESLADNITYIDSWAFGNCEKLAWTSLPSGLTSIERYTFMNCDNLALTSLPEGITSIGQQAFQRCPKITINSIPAGVTQIEDRAFINCTGLTSIIFKGTPEEIDATAFDGCTNLTEIKVPWTESDTINANAPWGATNATITYNYIA